MRRLPLRQVFLLGAALAAIPFLFLKSQGMGHENCEVVATTIRQLIKVEAFREEDLLKLRAGMLSHYDTLRQAEHTADELFERLSFHLTRLKLQDDATLKVMLAEIRQDLKDQAQLARRFEVKNALVAGSLASFPGEAKQILDITGDSPAYHVLDSEIQSLLSNILLYARNTSLVPKAELQDQIAAIRAGEPSLDANLANRIERWLGHAEVIVTHNAPVEKLVSEYIGASLIPALDEFLGAWEETDAEVHDREYIYAVSLFFVSLLMVVYLVKIFIKLAKTKRRLQQFNETLEEKIQVRTAELAAFNQRLEKANEEKTAVLGEFDAIYETIDYGIVFYDPGLRLRTANRAALEMWRISPELANSRPSCDELLDAVLENGLYDVIRPERGRGPDAVPEPGGVRTSKTFSGLFLKQGNGLPREIRRSDGRILECLCKALPDGSRMVTYLDVTERTRSQALIAQSRQDLEARVLELEELQLRLETSASDAMELAQELSQAKSQLGDAIASISEGFALWDDQDRLIMCNEQYREMYPTLASVIKPGVSFEDFARAAYQAGVFDPAGEELETALALRVLNHRHSVSATEEKLGNGRWVRISKRSTATGHVVGILTDISERKQSEATIQRMALEDALTGLPNRTQFHRNLRDALDQSERTGNLVGVMLLDLDHFKIINDTFGHPVGDALLKQVAARLAECARKTDTVARFGGDEFAVISTNAKDFEGITVLAERIVQAITRPFFIDGEEIHTGTSIGITVFPNDKGLPDHLLRNADLALYRAKADGRGTYRLYDEHMHTEVQARRAMEDDLRTALGRGQFSMVYQPQFCMGDGSIIGIESLLRWHHPRRGVVSPGEFIPVAETTRLIIPISEWILDHVCRQTKVWQDQGLPKVRVSVNLSPLHFRQRNMVEQVRGIIENSGLDPRWLELEITEGIAMESGDETLVILQQLKEIGVKLAIDDFGTGFSSLNRLKKFPVDRLKIDKSFVRDITTDWNDAAISSAVIRLGHSLNLKVIAEGVEDKDQYQFLAEQGCDEAQGFYFGRPMEPHDLITFFKTYEPETKRLNKFKKRRG